MISTADAVVRIPKGVPFTQAAPLMCAGATVWNALTEADVSKGQTVAIVGIGVLGLLAIQFAKARELRVIAISSRANNQDQISILPSGLGPDLVVNYKDSESTAGILPFTKGISIDAACVCTDNIEVNDWITHQLHPKGVCVVLRLPEKGFTFDAFNLIFREISIKSSLHCSMKDMEDMMTVVEKHGIASEVAIVPLEEAEDLPSKSAINAYKGKPVVIM
jgi:propanol-preferring alcohol dehydrogenase